jgi:hypothetical protein
MRTTLIAGLAKLAELDRAEHEDDRVQPAVVAAAFSNSPRTNVVDGYGLLLRRHHHTPPGNLAWPAGRRGVRKGHDATPRIRNPTGERRGEPQYEDLPPDVNRRLSSASQSSWACSSSSPKRRSAGGRLASDGPVDLRDLACEAPLSGSSVILASPVERGAVLSRCLGACEASTR